MYIPRTLNKENWFRCKYCKSFNRYIETHIPSIQVKCQTCKVFNDVYEEVYIER